MLTLLVLADESKTCMRLLGAETVDALGPQHVWPWPPYILVNTNSSQINTRMVEQQIYDGPTGLEPLRRVFRAKL